MPTELWGKIIVLLDLNDIKSFRLSWRRWTNITSRFLFRPFVFRVDREDLERFDTNSLNESMLAGINSLCFGIGTMGIGSAASQLGFEYVQEYNSARLPSPRTNYTKEELEIVKDIAVNEFAAWNTRWHEASQNFTDLNKITTILSKLNSLRRIDASGKATLFTTEMLLEAFWKSQTELQEGKQGVCHIAHGTAQSLFPDPPPYTRSATDNILLLERNSPDKTYFTFAAPHHPPPHN